MTRFSSKYRQCLLGLLAVWLTGCTIRQPLSPTDWVTHQRQLQQLIHYQARGSVIYRAAGHTQYARFHWQQHARHHFQLRLLTPLGQSLFTLHYQGSEGHLQMTQAGQTVSDQTAERRLQALLGFPLPLKALAHWLIGLPNPGDQIQRDEQQRLWQLTPAAPTLPPLQLRYLAYHPPRHASQPQAGRPALPAQLLLCCGAAQLTLKIDHWLLP